MAVSIPYSYIDYTTVHSALCVPCACRGSLAATFSDPAGADLWSFIATRRLWWRRVWPSQSIRAGRESLRAARRSLRSRRRQSICPTNKQPLYFTTCCATTILWRATATGRLRESIWSSSDSEWCQLYSYWRCGCDRRRLR